MAKILKAPFPYFGGKRRVAHIVWDRLGNTPNYCEPFAGSLAVLLGRPHEAGTETVNDKDCYVSNFWRALQADPDAVAKHADWPVNECDLHAKHSWLHAQADFRERLKRDKDFYDVEVAGIWVWGISSWIGDNWCRPNEQNPHLGNAGRGVNRQLPHLGDAGKGVNQKSVPLYDYMHALAARLRRVRVCCGDWTRVLTPSVTEAHGTTAVFLDSPYDTDGHDDCYGDMSRGVSRPVREWALANGDNKALRIALCGYEGEHVMPNTWECVAWKAAGGYGNQRKDNENAKRERIWFSPHCLKDAELF